MLRQSLTLGGLAAVNVIISFLYQWYVFVVLGPGRDTDALFAGMVVPQIVIAVVANSLAHVLVPLLAPREGEEFRRAAWTLVHAIGGFFAMVAIVLGATADLWVPLTVPGFAGQTRELTVELVRIQLGGMILSALAGSIWAVAHARQRFAWAEISPVIAGVAVFPLLALALPRFGVEAAAWAQVAKLTIQFVLLLPLMGGYRRPEWRSDVTTEAWRRLRPLLMGTSYTRLEVFVDRFLASLAPPGGLSLLHLGGQLYSAGHQVANTAIAAPAVPLLSRAAHERDWTRFHAEKRRRFRWMLALAGGAVVFAVALGLPLLDLLFGHGRFAAAEVRQLWLLVVALGGVGIGGALGQILAVSFYAAGDTATPTRIGVITFTFGAAAKVAGFFMFGVLGIAIASSIYYLTNVVLLDVALNRTIRPARRHGATRSEVGHV